MNEDTPKIERPSRRQLEELLHSEDIHLRLEPFSFDETLKRRILMTAQCEDAVSIPKVPGAGGTFAEGNHRYQLMHNGIKILEDCYYGSWMTELIRLLEGHHEPQEEKVFHELLRYVQHKGTMIELGSFWSYYSLWFHSSVPEARVFMVEPDANNLEVGRRNFALNGCSGAFFNYSVGQVSSGPEPFYCESDRLSRPVPKISVDDFIGQNEIEFVDLLLSDIQGAELDMLHGAQKSIAEGKIRFIVISTHHHSISKDPILHQRCLQFLRERRANIIAEHNVSESYSGDGLIAASFLAQDRDIPRVQISKNYSSNSQFREIEFDLAEANDLMSSLRQQVAELEAANNLRSQEIEMLNQSIAHTQVLLSEKEALISEKDALIASVLGSTSWKLSRPIRVVSERLRKMRSARD